MNKQAKGSERDGERERIERDEGIFPPLSTFVCCREMRFFHLENGREGGETDAAGSDDAHAPAANHCQYFFIVFALSHLICHCENGVKLVPRKM